MDAGLRSERETEGRERPALPDLECEGRYLRAPARRNGCACSQCHQLGAQREHGEEHEESAGFHRRRGADEVGASCYLVIKYNTRSTRPPI